MRNSSLAAAGAIAIVVLAWGARVPGVQGTQGPRDLRTEGPKDLGTQGQKDQGTDNLRPEVPPPPFSDGIFPCTTCHNDKMPPNRTRRELKDFHFDIELKHDAEHRWCLDCHDADNRDQLHLASGEPVPFAESYRLCGQCHGEKYRDWRAGVHGRRVGQWNGSKRYLLCVNCHSPHQPRFKPMKPQPAPHPPSRPK